MKIYTNLIRSTAVKYSFLAIIAITGMFLFQAQSTKTDNNAGDNGMVTDKWWVHSDFSKNVYQPPQPMVVVTTSDGYDNFNMGNDAAESSIATNPNNPLWYMCAYNGVPGQSSFAHHTENGYDPFASPTIPYPNSAGDPWVVYDSLGNLFTITLNGSTSGTWILKSTDNGATWGGAVAGCTGFDRENISADQTGGPNANNVYCGETGSGGATFYRSTDHGASFQSMVVLTPHTLPGFMCCVGPNGGVQGGSVYAVTYDYTGSFFPQSYHFHRSTNGGVTWTQNMSQITGIGFSGIDGGSGRGSINGMRTRAYPMIAADNSYGAFRGRFYCCWANNPGGTSGGHPDIYLKYSTDFGITWSSTVTVNDNPGTTTDEWFPAIWCDKKDGRLYVKWYSDQENAASFQTSVYAAYSTNGGVTFTASTKISNQSFPYPNVGPCANCVTNYRGDYDGIISNGYTSMSAWFDGRNASFGSFTGYFPDFAMKVNTSILNLNNVSDSGFSFISIPSVKLYTDRAKFTASISPAPSTGTVTMTFLNKTTIVNLDSLTTYPDSLRLRVKTSGGVTPSVFTITVSGAGTNGTPVHKRTITLNTNPLGVLTYGDGIPDNFFLYQNYPNPFNPSTLVRFDVAKAGNVKISVFDLTGKKVAELVNSAYNPGKYAVDFNGSNYASGVYFYKIETADYTSIKKMIMIK